MFLICIIFAFALHVRAEPLVSPTWGFRLDLPEGYELAGGDRKNSFSFESSFGTSLDLIVYTGFPSAALLAEETEKKLSSRGKRNVFFHNNREAVISELNFLRGNETVSGWALYLELDAVVSPDGRVSGTESDYRTYLLALAYGPQKPELQCLHLSVLDSIEGSSLDHLLPGAVTGFFHPGGEWISAKLANSKETAQFRKNDAAAAQSVVDREFNVMKLYLASPLWQEAWKRFYRAVYKDSFERLVHASFMMERSWNNLFAGSGSTGAGSQTQWPETRSAESYAIAARALEWVQGFSYERDLMGSDFINLVTVAQEGRGDCDSRAMLWAVVLSRANIPSGIMVSREYSHAMGLADLEGWGARLPMTDSGGREIKWLVAETTAKVSLGLIGETVSEISKWLGITFD